jgi:hypothetical protein
MAPSRYGSAGELLAWRPDHVGHGAFNGCDSRGHTGPLARECSVQVLNENSGAISQLAPKRKNANVAL